MRGHISNQQEQAQGSTSTRRRPGTPVRVSAGRSTVARGLSTFGAGGSTSPQRVLRASAPSLSAFCVNGSGITPARNPMSGRAAASGRHSDSSFGSGGGSMSGSGGHIMSGGGGGSGSGSAAGSDVSPPLRTTTRAADGPRTVGVVAAETGSMLRLEPTAPPVLHRYYCASDGDSCASEVDEEIPEALSCNGESVSTEGISEYQYDADFHYEQSDDNEAYDATPHTYAAPPLTAACPSHAAPAAVPSAPPAVTVAAAAASPVAATAHQVATPFIHSYSSASSAASSRDEASGTMRQDGAGVVGGNCHDLEAAAYEYDDDDDVVFAQCSAELQEYRRVAGRYQAQLRVYQDLLGRHQMGLLRAEDRDDDESQQLGCYSSDDDEDDGQLGSHYDMRWEGYGAGVLGTREEQRQAEEAEEAEEAEQRRRRFAEDGEMYAGEYAAHDVDDISYLMPHHGHGYDDYEIPPTPPHWSASASQFRWQLEYLQDPQRFMASHGYDYDSYALYGEREELDSELEAAAAAEAAGAGPGSGGERTWTPRNVAFGTSWTASGWLHSGLFCSSTLKHKPDDTTRRVLEDKEWIYALLQDLPGVDPDDDRVQGTLAALRGLKSCSRPTSSARPPSSSRPSSSLTLKAVAARPPSAVVPAVLPSLPTSGGGAMALPSSSLSPSPSRVHGGGGSAGTKPPSAGSSSKPREQSASRFSPAAAAGAIVR